MADELRDALVALADGWEAFARGHGIAVNAAYSACAQQLREALAPPAEGAQGEAIHLDFARMQSIDELATAIVKNATDPHDKNDPAYFSDVRDCLIRAQQLAAPPAASVGVELLLREALRTQSLRDDGSIPELAMRIRDMAREDRDCIAMQAGSIEEWKRREAFAVSDLQRQLREARAEGAGGRWRVAVENILGKTSRLCHMICQEVAIAKVGAELEAAPKPAGGGNVVADPHHNGACEWRWEGNRLFHRTPASAPWVECKRVSVTPKRIAAIYGALPAPPAASVDVEGLREVAARCDAYAKHRKMTAYWRPAFVSLHRMLVTLIDSAGGAKGEDYKPVLCVKCGHPTMHIGNVCFACSRESRGPQPAEGDGAVLLRTAAEYHYAQATCPRDQFGNTSNHKNPKLEAWHRQIGDAITKAITRPAATAVVPEGFVLVPREPTEAMRRRGADRWIEANENAMTRKDEEESARCAWAAMLAAAPAAPKGGVVDEAQHSAAFDAFLFHRSHGAGEREAIYAALTAALNPEQQS